MSSIMNTSSQPLSNHRQPTRHQSIPGQFRDYESQPEQSSGMSQHYQQHHHHYRHPNLNTSLQEHDSFLDQQDYTGHLSRRPLSSEINFNNSVGQRSTDAEGVAPSAAYLDLATMSGSLVTNHPSEMQGSGVGRSDEDEEELFHMFDIIEELSSPDADVSSKWQSLL